MANEEFNKFVDEHKKNVQDMNKRNASVSGEENSQEVSNAELLKQFQALSNEVASERKKREKVEKENKHLKAVNNNLTDEVEADHSAKNEEAVNDVIKGFKTFKKHYRFPVAGEEPLEFDIELKPLSLTDISNLQQEVTQTTNGQNRFFDDTYQELFEAASIFRVAAIKCPEDLKNPDNIHRIDIPVTIYRDYLSWLDSFRQSQKF